MRAAFYEHGSCHKKFNQLIICICNAYLTGLVLAVVVQHLLCQPLLGQVTFSVTTKAEGGSQISR